MVGQEGTFSRRLVTRHVTKRYMDPKKSQKYCSGILRNCWGYHPSKVCISVTYNDTVIDRLWTLHMSVCRSEPCHCVIRLDSMFPPRRLACSSVQAVLIELSRAGASELPGDSGPGTDATSATVTSPAPSADGLLSPDSSHCKQTTSTAQRTNRPADVSGSCVGKHNLQPRRPSATTTGDPRLAIGQSPGSVPSLTYAHPTHPRVIQGVCLPPVPWVPSTD
jgi:hypothetical protein